MPMSIDGYPVDACKTEALNAESEVTEHPVENGTAIADHVIVKPLEYSCECVVSNTPIGAIALDPTRQAGEGTPLPSQDCFNRLIALRNSKRAITVVTLRFGTLTNMELTKFEPKTEPGTGDSLQFTATFRQITIITNKRTTVQVAVPSAGPESDQGNLKGGAATGKYVTWNHGSPPGGPAIFFTEVLSMVNKNGNPPAPAGKGKAPPAIQTMLVHPTSQDKSRSGKELTTGEYAAFQLDFQRDSSASLQKQIDTNDRKLNEIDDTLKRAQAFADAKDAAAKDPSKGPVSREMFGL